LGLFLSRRNDKPIANIPNRANQSLVLGAEFCPQPPHVNINGSGPAEVVVTPNLLQQLRPGEYSTGMLRQIFE
jgi:hypothetical protein